MAERYERRQVDESARLALLALHDATAAAAADGDGDGDKDKDKDKEVRRVVLSDWKARAVPALLITLKLPPPSKDKDEDKDDAGDGHPPTKYHVVAILSDGVGSYRGVRTRMFLVEWWVAHGPHPQSWEPFQFLNEDCPLLLCAYLHPL